MINFINLSDIKEVDLRKIIANAKSKKLKKNLNNKDKALINKTLIMIFEKPSTRTRISFELAMKRLGGNSIILNPEQIHYGRGNENIHDTAKVLSQYGDIIMMRADKHENFLKFSKYLNIPIINGLTDLNHPCQTMSDIATFEELKGSIKNKKIAWLGDGNNIVYSLIEASVKFNFQLAIACPKKLEPNKKIVKWAKNKKAKILITQDPKKAVNLADCIMTDKWISMGDKSNEKKRKNY